MTEKERLLAELKLLEKENKDTKDIERKKEIARRFFQIQTRLGKIIPEQNAGRMYEER